MAKTKDYLWEILVPTVRSQDKGYTTKYHRLWDEKVRAISGGLTVLKPAHGQWVAPDGELFKERMIPVRISCTESEIDQISDITAKHYNQKAVMYYRVSDMVVVKHYEVKG